MRRENHTASAARVTVPLARTNQMPAHAFRPMLQTQCTGEPNVNIQVPLHLKRDGHNARKLVTLNLGVAYAPTTHARFRYPNSGGSRPRHDTGAVAHSPISASSTLLREDAR